MSSNQNGDEAMEEESAKCLLAQPIKPPEVCHFHISGPTNISLLVDTVFSVLNLEAEKSANSGHSSFTK